MSCVMNSEINLYKPEALDLECLMGKLGGYQIKGLTTNKIVWLCHTIYRRMSAAKRVNNCSLVSLILVE